MKIISSASKFVLLSFFVLAVLGDHRSASAQTTAAKAAPADAWKVGAAKLIITPVEPMWMAGYGGRTAPSSGKLSELYAKLLVLDAGSPQSTAAVLTLDLVGIEMQLSLRIRKSIGDILGIDGKQVLVACSHTHSGPVVGKNLSTLHYYQLDARFQKQIDQYAVKLHDDCVTLARMARESMQPCTVSWGTGAADFATNRRNNKEAEVPALRSAGKLNGPFDYDVPVLAARTGDGKLMAVLFGYACHATVLSGQVWSGDYPGYAQAALEERHPGCTALFFAGCGADQNPLPRRTPDLAKHYGERLANAVDTILMTTSMTAAPRKLECKYEEVALPLAQLPTKEELEKALSSTNKSESTRARVLLKQLEDGKPLSQTYPYPISVWKIGNAVTLVSLGGEVVVDYALAIKSQLDHSITSPVWVAGYSNDVMAYIPSRRVLAEGGYEGGGSMVYYGLPCFWAPELEKTILDGVDRLRK